MKFPPSGICLTVFVVFFVGGSAPQETYGETDRELTVGQAQEISHISWEVVNSIRLAYHAGVSTGMGIGIMVRAKTSNDLELWQGGCDAVKGAMSRVEDNVTHAIESDDELMTQYLFSTLVFTHMYATATLSEVHGAEGCDIPSLPGSFETSKEYQELAKTYKISLDEGEVDSRE